eukprot:scaffold162226_cov48-Tisochrysis_lutea.AAC.2
MGFVKRCAGSNMLSGSLQATAALKCKYAGSLSAVRRSRLVDDMESSPGQRSVQLRVTVHPTDEADCDIAAPIAIDTMCRPQNKNDESISRGCNHYKCCHGGKLWHKRLTLKAAQVRCLHMHNSSSRVRLTYDARRVASPTE